MGYISFGYEGNEVHYSEAEFKRDLRRYFDTLEETVHCHPCKLSEDCEKCMFFNHELCGKYYVNSRPIKNSFEIIEKVYRWAKEHPIVTNRDKLIKTFGNKNFNFILSSLRNDMIDEYGKWLHEEYKEPDQ